MNIALVGGGKFGERHLATLMRLQDEEKCNLVAAVDISRDQLGRLEKRYGCRVETSLDTVLPEVEAVDIVTPASTHYYLAKRCLLANKHVMIEKPMTTSFKEALEIHNLGATRKKTVGIGHVFRYHELTEKLKKMIHAEMVQSPLLIEAQFLNPNEPREDVGSILNYSHWVDLCNYLLESTPSSVSCSVYRNQKKEFEDNASLIMNYEHGTQANLMMGWAGRRKKRYFSIEAANASMLVDYLDGSVQFLTGGGKADIRVESFRLTVDPSTEPLYLELSDFINSVESGEVLLADSRSGVISVYLCERALRSATERRALDCDDQAKILGGEVFSTSDSIAVR